jgi:hypothetical protein
MNDENKPMAGRLQKEQPVTIELRVEEVSQLFDTLDPFPFLEKDLDKDAEEYIVGWARELPRNHPIKILVHLPKAESERKRAEELGEAFSRFFQYRADRARQDLNEMFRVGRRSLGIGLAVLAACLLAGEIVNGRLGTGYVANFIEQSLVILAWVANWRPIEIFLYDWWPLSRRLNLYQRLAQADVGLKPDVIVR